MKIVDSWHIETDIANESLIVVIDGVIYSLPFPNRELAVDIIEDLEQLRDVLPFA